MDLADRGDLAEYFLDPGLDLGPAFFIRQGKTHHQLSLPDALDARSSGGGAEVVGQFAHEPGAVLALESQLVGLDDGV